MRTFFVQFRSQGVPTLTGARVVAKDIFGAVQKAKEHIERDGILLPCDELIVRRVEVGDTSRSRRGFTAEERKRMSDK